MFTKDVVAKLTPEQQEILAQMEFRRTQRQLKLLATARGCDWRSRYFPVFYFGVFLLLLGAYGFNIFPVQAQLASTYLPVGAVMVFLLYGNSSRTNRRLDALLELLDLERRDGPLPRGENAPVVAREKTPEATA